MVEGVRSRSYGVMFVDLETLLTRSTTYRRLLDPGSAEAKLVC